MLPLSIELKFVILINAIPVWLVFLELPLIAISDGSFPFDDSLSTGFALRDVALVVEFSRLVNDAPPIEVFEVCCLPISYIPIFLIRILDIAFQVELFDLLVVCITQGVPD